jgi:phosphoglycolate phosphatase
MTLRDYAAYIFDLDGTLLTIPVDWAKARDEVGKMAGVPLGDAPLFAKMEQLVSVRPSIRESLFAMIDRHELEAVPSSAPAEGALELLTHLSKEAEVGLVTMQGSAACGKVLSKHRFGDFFETRVTREDSLDRAAQLRLALQSLGSAPGDALFTGDLPNDVLCGKKVGVDTLLLGGDPSGSARPTYAYPTLASLRDDIL